MSKLRSDIALTKKLSAKYIKLVDPTYHKNAKRCKIRFDGKISNKIEKNSLTHFSPITSIE